jgi:ribosome-interacting GTPase 1
MNANEYLKSIDCFNIIDLRRDRSINTLGKIMESYHQEKLKELGIPHVSERVWTVDEIIETLNCSDDVEETAKWFDKHGR